MKILIVVDMQNDFIYGPLGTDEAKNIVPAVIDKIEEYYDNNNNNPIIFTQDTHYNDYLYTLEGKKLPIPHCICGSEGWDLIPEINYLKRKLNLNADFVNKESFGFNDWEGCLEWNEDEDFMEHIESIELCGVCTDICVVSNALILRALYPDKKIIVDAKCCAGVTPEKHKAALEVMKSCQIDVINE